jgi:hypothetical protein
VARIVVQWSGNYRDPSATKITGTEDGEIVLFARTSSGGFKGGFVPGAMNGQPCCIIGVWPKSIRQQAGLGVRVEEIERGRDPPVQQFVVVDWLGSRRSDHTSADRWNLVKSLPGHQPSVLEHGQLDHALARHLDV